uniref:Uncharacterized protein n=1 Tax=viral metagenome TaxID=1070528 RepID=A0A6C0BN12_9ZZZZ
MLQVPPREIIDLTQDDVQGEDTPKDKDVIDLTTTEDFWNDLDDLVKISKQYNDDRYFSPAEVKRIHEAANLYQVWGYRYDEGKDYEQKTQGAYRDLVAFTDPLMRNLQQVHACGRTFVFRCDMEDLYSYATLAPPSDHVRRDGPGIIRQYLAEPGIGKQLVDFAGQDPHSASPMYSGLIIAARSILAIAADDWDTAIRLFQELLKDLMY